MYNVIIEIFIGGIDMAISIIKGQQVDLSNSTDVYSKLVVGLGWDVGIYNVGVDFDLDASVFMLGENGRVNREKDFVFYNNLVSTFGSIAHLGDNRTGVGEGDDEQIVIDLQKIPADITRIAITVTIHEAKTRRQNFGLVSNSFVRVLEFDSQKELLRYDLEEDFSIVTAIVVCEIFKHDGLWKFAAVGDGLSGGLENLCNKFGAEIKDSEGNDKLVKHLKT